jgi:hypothetical protein
MKSNTILATLTLTLGSAAVLMAQSSPRPYDNNGRNNGNNNGAPPVYDSRTNPPAYDDRYDDDRYGNNGYYGDAPNAYEAPPPPQPPPPAYAYRPASPGYNYVWIDGFWNWSGRRYAWTAGYWAPRPYMSAFWVAPRYRAGRYYQGYWGGNNRDNRRPAFGPDRRRR